MRERPPQPPSPLPRGRGCPSTPVNRFEPLHVELDPEDGIDTSPRDPRTQVLLDRSQTILTHNQSPDVPFDTSLNPYRGCEHGCSYCYARPTHEYLGLSAGLDFETRIVAKPDAPRLLRQALDRPRWTPHVLALSGITDPYQPIERSLRVTRGCLEVLREYRQPVGVITKSALVTRDADLLADLARHRAVHVTLSVTTLDTDLARRMEPRAAQPKARLRAITRLAAAGIPTGANLAPIIPGLNDHEIPRLLAALSEAGAQWAQLLILRLPLATRELFDAWLQSHFPERREKVLRRLRAMRSGRLQESRFGLRMRGSGPFYAQIRDLFELSRARAGLASRPPELDTAAFRRPHGAQLELW